LGDKGKMVAWMGNKERDGGKRERRERNDTIVFGLHK
jgi:hypothetical protein